MSITKPKYDINFCKHISFLLNLSQKIIAKKIGNLNPEKQFVAIYM